jgi:hypothetical protein
MVVLICTVTLKSVSDLATFATVPSGHDERTDYYVALLEIGKIRRSSDIVEHHFNFTYLSFKQITFYIQANKLQQKLHFKAQNLD